MATAMTGTPVRVSTAPRQTVRRAHSSVRVQASSRVDQFNKSDIIVSPSILSANFSKLGEQVCRNNEQLRACACAPHRSNDVHKIPSSGQSNRRGRV